MPKKKEAPALTVTEMKELEDLYALAEGNMLSKHDFNAADWLDGEDLARFRHLYKKDNGFCPDSECGDRDCINCS